MRTLILHASIGGGHRAAALALAEAFADLDPAGESEVRDVLDFTPSLFRKVYRDSYAWLVSRRPELWGYLYELGPARSAERAKARVVRAFDRLNYRKLLRFLDGFRPDAIMATHFLPGEILLPLRDANASIPPLYVVLTDHDAHPMWIRAGARAFFTASEEVRALVVAAGIDPADVHATGIPISRRFSRRPDREAARAGLSLPGGARVVLLMSGGFGFGEILPFADAVADLEDTAVLAVAGRNEKLLAALREREATRPGLRAFGFVDDIERLMAAADVVVTKSGGLTVSECLAAGRPLIVVRPTPGQEERNADFLLENGAALKAMAPEILRLKLRRLWADPDRLAALSRSALALGRPDAATDIARAVLDAGPTA